MVFYGVSIEEHHFVLLTESLFAEHGVTGLTGFALSGHINGSHPERVLLLLHQALQEVLQDVDVLRHTDPVHGATLQHLNDVAVDLGSTVVLRFGPHQEAGRLSNVLHLGFTGRPWRIWKCETMFFFN